ncbi:MAG TPA: FecR family protein [Puia sp.]|nr:FecR family protein [Puia sp.]
MSQHEFDDILQKYLDGECTPQEEKIILEWYKTFINETEITLSPEEKQALQQKIWTKIQPGIPQIQSSVPGIQPGLRTGFPQSPFTVPQSPSGLPDLTPNRPAIVRSYNGARRWWRVAAAASLLAAALAGGYLYLHQPAGPDILAFSRIRIPEGYSVIYNHKNTIRPVPLSDGSLVELQPQSALYYPTHFTGATRNVYLTGNAFFRIEHDSSRHFIVHTDEGLLAEDLGTSFYVLHNKTDNKVEVAVVSGKVSVYNEKWKGTVNAAPENGRIILTPNQKVSYKPLNNQFITSLVEEPKPVTPVPGSQPALSFVFDEAPLSKVLKALETSYGIVIQTENEQLNNCHFTGNISRQNLYEKLDILCKSTQSSYEVRGTVIYMRGKGCN